MKVRAIKRGFFGGLYRNPSDSFDCPEDAFSSVWMEKVTKGMKPLEENDYKPLEIPSLTNKKPTVKKVAKKTVAKKPVKKRGKK